MSCWGCREREDKRNPGLCFGSTPLGVHFCEYFLYGEARGETNVTYFGLACRRLSSVSVSPAVSLSIAPKSIQRKAFSA